MTTTREPILLRPIEDSDPRLHVEPRELQLASRNAYPLVAQQGKKSDSLGLAAGAGIAVLLGGVTFWSMSQHRAPTPEPKPALAAPVAASPAPALPPRPAPVVPLPVAAPTVSAPAIAAAASPAMVFDNSQAPAGQTATTTTPASAKTADGKPLTGDDNDQFALRVGGSSDVATAEPMSSPSDTITQGTLIPAVLETAIDTDLPGYVRAVVSRDVRSFDGTKVLIPRSSRLVGQYKSGLSAGQTRAYVIWSRLIRPDGVSIALGSPAVDFSGMSGLGGKVDSHFLKRFSSAVLLSVVGGLSSIAGNASVIVSGGQSAASVAAQHDTQIAPTVKVPQGQPIRVFTARDLDFSTANTAG
jgi:type IV secretion system protein VirB10